MSSSMAIATIAVANSAAASTSAQEALSAANRAECMAKMSTSTDSGSSIAAKRQYAACVESVHPTPSSPPTPHEKAFVGGITVFLVISVVIGAWRMHKSFGGYRRRRFRRASRSGGWYFCSGTFGCCGEARPIPRIMTRNALEGLVLIAAFLIAQLWLIVDLWRMT